MVDRVARPGQLPESDKLTQVTTDIVGQYEDMGLSDLLIAQRWWGSGEEIEASTLDCLAMTAYFAAHTSKIKLVTAIHPGFFQPTAIAKWGATIDRISGGRWAINVTSGWNLTEFDMYGIDRLSHDERYARSAEFINVLRGAWEQTSFSHDGRFYQADQLQMEPRPSAKLEVFQGGQSNAAIEMAAEHSDWMFLNGGTPERIAEIISRVGEAARQFDRRVRFAMYAAPLCRDTDEAAWAVIDERLARVDPALLERRKDRVSGAEGMWGGPEDPLSALDTNEGYAARLIGSPATVLNGIREFRAAGVEMMHLDVSDPLFVAEVLPAVHAL